MSAVAHDVTYCYDIELSEFCDMMRTGRMPEDYDRLARPGAIAGAHRARISGAARSDGPMVGR